MFLDIDLGSQTLTLSEARDSNTIKAYPVSTSRYGAGEIRDSYKTPRGLHMIRAKVGAGRPANTVFQARRPTGEIFDEEMKVRYPNRDWILTRILWLSGLEKGKNRLGDVDTMRRFIYIHGCPDSTRLGVPGSIGCIRMNNQDLIELFDRVSVGDIVNLSE
jgi:lipoprotein-anchoring transpeptidase ErfK/SrfK